MIQPPNNRVRRPHLVRTLVAVSCAVLLQSSMTPAFAKHKSDPLQGGTDSTMLQGGTGSTTLQTGTESTTLQTGTEGTLLQGGAAGSMLQAGVEQEAGPINILFLLDASYSMKEKMSGTPKMSLAKSVLEDGMRRIPNDVNVGLRVFGQTHYPGLMNDMDCMATALLVPLGMGNRGAVISRVRLVEPNGMTPLEYALRAAAEDDFRDVQGRKVIILISDGMDTCGGNPCAFIAMLPQYGIHIKVDVVGVDLKHDMGAKKQLDCLARTSGGKYYDADTAAKLIDSVSASIDKAVSGKVIMHQHQPAKNTETQPEQLHATPAPLPQQ